MNILQFAPNREKTSSETLKSRVLEIARELLRIYEDDIESGIDDGTYKASENTETRAFIAEAIAKFDEFEKQQPAIYICVEGGNVQGASATCEIDFNLYDVDNYNTSESIEDEQTPEEWDTQIQQLTLAKEIKAIY